MGHDSQPLRPNDNAPAVVVAQNGTTVQDFAIPAITSYTVSGTVTQSGTGTGVPAMIMVANQNLLAPVWAAATDAPGDYSIVVPAGPGTSSPWHPGYNSGHPERRRQRQYTSTSS